MLANLAIRSADFTRQVDTGSFSTNFWSQDLFDKITSMFYSPQWGAPMIKTIVANIAGSLIGWTCYYLFVFRPLRRKQQELNRELVETLRRLREGLPWALFFFQKLVLNDFPRYSPAFTDLPQVSSEDSTVISQKFPSRLLSRRAVPTRQGISLFVT